MLRRRVRLMLTDMHRDGRMVRLTQGSEEVRVLGYAYGEIRRVRCGRLAVVALVACLQGATSVAVPSANSSQ